MAHDLDQTDELIQLVHGLYAGLLGNLPWRDFLRALAHHLGSSYATLILARPGDEMPGEVMIPDANPSAAHGYAAQMFRVDPFVGLPEGEIVDYAEFVDEREQSDEWHRFMQWSGAGHILGLDLSSEQGLQARFRVTRNRSRSPFTETDRRRFARLVPLLRTAFLLHEKLLAHAIEQDVYCGAIERLAVGTILLDRRGQILGSNAVADRLLSARDGLAVHDGRLRLTPASAHKALEAILAGQGAHHPARITVWRPRAEQQLALVIKLVGEPDAPPLRGPAFALFVGDPDHHCQPDPDALQDIFQLTRMEASITAQLAMGQSLVTAANKLGIAHSTARTHLRAVFAKTGVQRQSQLLRLIQSSLLELSDPS